MRKLQNSNNSSAEDCWGVQGHNCSADFLPHAKHLSAIEKSAFTDILGEDIHNCLYRHVESIVTYKKFVGSLFVEDIFQDVLKCKAAFSHREKQ